MEHSVKVCSINFFVSVRTLTVLAIKVISVKRLLSFINYTAFIGVNKRYMANLGEYCKIYFQIGIFISIMR